MKRPYVLSADVLRLLAILAVILIHTTTRTLELSHYELQKIPVTFFLNQLGIFAVPLFFLISGFVLGLHNTNIHYLQFLKKRIFRIIIPYIFWSMFYFFVYPKAHDQNESFIYLLLTGNASYQLYFIPTIIIFYFLFPFISRSLNFFSKKSSIVFLAVSEVILLIKDYYIHEFYLESCIRVALLAFVFFIFGVLASQYQDKILIWIKKYLFYIPFLLFGVVIFAFSESWYLYEQTKNIHYFYSQFHPIVLPYTLLVAAGIYYVFSIKEYGKKYITLFSKLSFFVFFVHVSVIYTVWYPIEDGLFSQAKLFLFGEIVYELLFFLVVSTLSFLIAYIIHKLPYVSKITG